MPATNPKKKRATRPRHADFATTGLGGLQCIRASGHQGVIAIIHQFFLTFAAMTMPPFAGAMINPANLISPPFFFSVAFGMCV
jgi:hypothetical protein